VSKFPKHKNQTDLRRLLNLLGPADADSIPLPTSFNEALKMYGTKDRKLERGPCGKMMFPSQHRAEEGLRHLLKKGMANTSKLRCYRCPECNAWHLSSSFSG